jgi:hypothetical protein
VLPQSPGLIIKRNIFLRNAIKEPAYHFVQVELHPFDFHSGASGMMTENYFITKGQTLKNGLNLLKSLKLKPRKNFV